jgi:hypothetical protein
MGHQRAHKQVSKHSGRKHRNRVEKMHNIQIKSHMMKVHCKFIDKYTKSQNYQIIPYPYKTIVASHVLTH